MLKYISGVVTLELDAQKCNGCGMCAIVCPHGVFIVSDRMAQITDRDLCIECGACARNCPTAAISVHAGVGCATGHILAALGSTDDCCCAGEGPNRAAPTTPRGGKRHSPRKRASPSSPRGWDSSRNTSPSG